MRLIGLVAAGAILLAGSASAETIERTVKANMISAIGGFAGYEVDTCYASVIPDIKVKQAPANGSIEIRHHEAVLGKDTRCPGTKVKGLVYVYTPKKGYKGADEVVLDVPWRSTDTGQETIWTYTYRIKVE